ncbi:MAG: RIP metalloprotease RseP, partial [Gammaproteobacteria bacterium]
MAVMQNILALIVVLGVLITVHEYGHFWVARRCGIKVIRFSIGFGSTLFSWKDKLGTEYVIAALPLGGFVRMLDERESEVPEHMRSQAFNNKPVWQRMAVVVAGPLVNLVFAVLLYWVMFVNGVTGIIPNIGSVEVGSLAERSGLQMGQEIVAIDGKETPSWEEVNFALLGRLGDRGEIDITVQEEGSSLQKSLQVPIDLWLVGREKEGPLNVLGVRPVRPLLAPVI